MRRMAKLITMALATAGAIAPAAAAPILFTGEGVVASSFGPLTPTGTAPVGSTVRFSFTFDLDDAAFVFANPFSAGYSVPFTDFTTTIGSFTFTPVGDARLTIGRGFSNFGGNVSEPSRNFSFGFSGPPRPGAPFAGGTGDSFTVFATFRDPDPTSPLSLADVADPRDAPRRTFSYAATAFTPPGTPPQFGALSGNYDGRFATAAVPEPASWALMIGGFGLAGAALRRRRYRPALTGALAG